MRFKLIDFSKLFEMNEHIFFLILGLDYTSTKDSVLLSWQVRQNYTFLIDGPTAYLYFLVNRPVDDDDVKGFAIKYQAIGIDEIYVVYCLLLQFLTRSKRFSQEFDHSGALHDSNADRTHTAATRFLSFDNGGGFLHVRERSVRQESNGPDSQRVRQVVRNAGPR